MPPKPSSSTRAKSRAQPMISRESASKASAMQPRHPQKFIVLPSRKYIPAVIKHSSRAFLSEPRGRGRAVGQSNLLSLVPECTYKQGAHTPRPHAAREITFLQAPMQMFPYHQRFRFLRDYTARSGRRALICRARAWCARARARVYIIRKGRIVIYALKLILRREPVGNDLCARARARNLRERRARVLAR